MMLVDVARSQKNIVNILCSVENPKSDPFSRMAIFRFNKYAFNMLITRIP